MNGTPCSYCKRRGWCYHAVRVRLWCFLSPVVTWGMGEPGFRPTMRLQRCKGGTPFRRGWMLKTRHSYLAFHPLPYSDKPWLSWEKAA